MKKLLPDYRIPQDTMFVFCDNTSAINLSKNPVQHSKSKHIEICYHFIRDLVEDKVMCLEFIHTNNQKADIFTKPLDGPRFESLRKTIGIGTIPWISCVICALLIYLDLISLAYSTHYFVSHMYSMFWQFLFVFKSFECFLFYQSLLTFVSKIQKHIKNRKSKKFNWHYCVLSHACFALYLHRNGFVHLQA